MRYKLNGGEKPSEVLSSISPQDLPLTCDTTTWANNSNLAASLFFFHSAAEFNLLWELWPLAFLLPFIPTHCLNIPSLWNHFFRTWSQAMLRHLLLQNKSEQRAVSHNTIKKDILKTSFLTDFMNLNSGFSLARSIMILRCFRTTAIVWKFPRQKAQPTLIASMLFLQIQLP